MNSEESLEAFKAAIRAAGGSESAIEGAIEAETQELFGCSIEELYRRTGGILRDRSTLPLMVQLAYIQNEAACVERL